MNTFSKFIDKPIVLEYESSLHKTNTLKVLVETFLWGCVINSFSVPILRILNFKNDT